MAPTLVFGAELQASCLIQFSKDHLDFGEEGLRGKGASHICCAELAMARMTRKNGTSSERRTSVPKLSGVVTVTLEARLENFFDLDNRKKFRSEKHGQEESRTWRTSEGRR